jgi:DNA repair protein RadC
VRKAHDIGGEYTVRDSWQQRRLRIAGASAGTGIAVKELTPDDRPREKLSRLGVDGLGDNELAAIVLGTGARSRSALDLANALLAALGGIHGLTRVTLDDLQRLPGIGPVRATQLVAAVELGRRTLMRPAIRREQILTPRDAAAYLTPRFSARGVEHFGLILLDVRYRVIRTTMLTTGGVESAPVHPRDVFREAATGRASAVVLFHNHPSGDPTPSQDDVVLTARLLRAGEVMGIDVVDHLILADNRYYSFRESGALVAALTEMRRV